MDFSNFIIGISDYNDGFEAVRDFKPFSIFLTSSFRNKDLREIKEFIRDLKKFSGYDLKFSTDQEGGYASWILDGYPSPMRWAQKSFKEFERSCKEMARKLKNIGIDINFAPCVDICYDNENEVICKKERSFSNSLKTVVDYSYRFYKIMKENGIECCAKHFVNQARAKDDPHKDLPISDFSLKDIIKDFLPYKVLIKEGLFYIMVGYIKYKKISEEPVIFSSYFIKELLRKRLSFRGKVITDDLLMGGIKKFYPLSESIKLSIKAGCDLILISDFKFLKKFLKKS
ncbi:MAG: glycoside hydrolase family 3 N-terminal domain-containing protein [Candidatus Hydrothermales bacterium]